MACSLTSAPEACSFSGWKIGVKKVVLKVLIRLAAYVDVLVFEVVGVRSAWLVRWWLRPATLRGKAVALAGVEEERYHVSIAEMDRRLQRSIDAVAAMDEESALRHCGRRGGGTLRVGLVALRALERRLIRQLVVDLLMTTTTTTTTAKKREEEDPQDPVVIIGPQRSGTTILLELLGKDSTRWRQLKTFEATLPVVPEPLTATLREAVHEWLAGTEHVLDEVRHIHHERWDGPAECRALLENGVGAPYVLWYVFGATRSIDDWQTSTDDYAFYKAQLGALLQTHDRRRWLLKDPAHCFSLDALLEAFPKATLVWTHRHPADVAASLCSLMQGIWSATLREERLQRRKSKEESHKPTYDAAVVEYLATMLDRAVEFRARHPEARIIDVPMRDLRENPMKVIEDIYDFAEAGPLAPAARDAMLAFLAKENASSKKRHTYDLADFGLDRDYINRRFANYINAPFFPKEVVLESK